MRAITPPEYCHERLGGRFASALSAYDTGRRVEVLVDRFLTDEMVEGKTALDVGCGLGFFSQRLRERGAEVVACDVGPGLVEATRARVGCRGVVADALGLARAFGERGFDLVVSSECIEHTPRPGEAVRQMAAVLRPGGYLSLSTPNLVWAPVVKAATSLGLRPFDGYENFSSWWGLRAAVRAAGLAVRREHGLHLFPFQLPLHRLSRWCDAHFQPARSFMINICLLAQKPDESAGRVSGSDT